jgi:hypothetical protein
VHLTRRIACCKVRDGLVGLNVTGVSPALLGLLLAFFEKTRHHPHEPAPPFGPAAARVGSGGGSGGGRIDGLVPSASEREAPRTVDPWVDRAWLHATLTTHRAFSPHWDVQPSLQLVLDRLDEPATRLAVSRLVIELRMKHGAFFDMLRRLDANGDGRLRQSEVVKGLIALRVQLSEAELASVLGAFDKDGDGTVSPGADVGPVPAQMWGQSRRRCGPVPAQMWASPSADVGRVLAQTCAESWRRCADVCDRSSCAGRSTRIAQPHLKPSGG